LNVVDVLTVRNEYSNLNWLRPLWEGEYGAVKRSGRDGPSGVVIHNTRNLPV
jgi:hypothetical protein